MNDQFSTRLVPEPVIFPKYTHDCKQCVFLGYTLWSRDDETGSTVESRLDLYYHHSATPILRSVIARFGSNGSDYYSGLHIDMPVLEEARRLAKLKGLL